VDLGGSGTIQSLGDVIERGSLVGFEAAAQGRDRRDLLPDPRTPVDGDFYVWLPGEKREDEERYDGENRILEA
jgi:hypothetical protein